MQASVYTFTSSILKDLLEVFTPKSKERSKEYILAILIARLIAELAKTEEFRDRFAETGSIAYILRFFAISCDHFVEDPLGAHEMDLLTIQLCRCCGNLCYEHGNAIWPSQNVEPSLNCIPSCRGQSRRDYGGSGKNQMVGTSSFIWQSVCCTVCCRCISQYFNGQRTYSDSIG